MTIASVSSDAVKVLNYKRIKHSLVFPKTFIFQATIKQYQTAENIDFAWVFFSLYFQICTVVKEQDMYIELKH